MKEVEQKNSEISNCKLNFERNSNNIHSLLTPSNKPVQCSLCSYSTSQIHFHRPFVVVVYGLIRIRTFCIVAVVYSAVYESAKVEDKTRERIKPESICTPRMKLRKGKKEGYTNHVLLQTNLYL